MVTWLRFIKTEHLQLHNVFLSYRVLDCVNDSHIAAAVGNDDGATNHVDDTAGIPLVVIYSLFDDTVRLLGSIPHHFAAPRNGGARLVYQPLQVGYHLGGLLQGGIYAGGNHVLQRVPRFLRLFGILLVARLLIRIKCIIQVFRRLHPVVVNVSVLVRSADVLYRTRGGLQVVLQARAYLRVLRLQVALRVQSALAALPLALPRRPLANSKYKINCTKSTKKYNFFVLEYKKSCNSA
ncbi:MAG: hypothetical protein Q3986_05505 [Akkermansia sp.]|nr:hypothetical protein [Akkermansia sp.]